MPKDALALEVDNIQLSNLANYLKEYSRESSKIAVVGCDFTVVRIENQDTFLKSKINDESTDNFMRTKPKIPIYIGKVSGPRKTYSTYYVDESY